MDSRSSESDEDSSDEDEDGGRPVSVNDIRLQAAAMIRRPKSAGGASQNVGPSMTPTGAPAGAPPNPNTRNTII